MKSLVIEDCVHILEEESIEKAVKIESLSLEVERLQEKLCCHNELRSRLLLGSRTAEDPHKLEYMSDGVYVTPPVTAPPVTMLVPIKAEEAYHSSRALHFGDDKETSVAESHDVSLEITQPQENEVPILIYMESSPSHNATPVCSSP